jgi:hypothetical protein
MELNSIWIPYYYSTISCEYRTRYNQVEVVCKPLYMKEKKLFEECRKVTKQFYTMPKVIQHAPIPTLQNTPTGSPTTGQLSLETHRFITNTTGIRATVRTIRPVK